MHHESKEASADLVPRLSEIRRLVFASHDARLVSRFCDVIGPCGIDVLSLTDVGLPEPQWARTSDDVHVTAIGWAALVASLTDIPAVGLARGFYIDPLLRWGGGGPQWSWPVPWPFAIDALAAELRRADIDLDASGYCTPDDRGAYLRSVLCLAWPNDGSQVFEGRLEGHFREYGRASRPDDLVEDYFVPDGETAALARLPDKVRQRYSDQQRAFETFRDGLSEG